MPQTLAELTVRAQALIAQARTVGHRQILGIAGPPGAGKSTLAEALAAALGPDAVVVGMDGFHLANAELERLGRRARKGAPDTFDIDGYLALLRRLRQPSETVIYAPRFDRGLEESIGSAIPVSPETPLVSTEGNYLLLDAPGWCAVADYLDESWYLEVPEDLRMSRLVTRRQTYGDAVPDARAWVATVDEPNAAVVESSRERADICVMLTLNE